MSCCQWKRSPNDCLYDQATNKRYCATCWQAWIRNQPEAPFREQDAEVSVSTEAGDEIGEDASIFSKNNPSILPLERKTHTDGKSYLISQPTRLVFTKIPTLRKCLQCVGEATFPDKEIKLYKVTTVLTTSNFPYGTEAEDHCETPQQAYDDLAPILNQVAELLNKTASTLAIWDPYYCAGTVKKRLRRHGFSNVRNDCQDFYKLIENNDIPPHDVIVTNPPYSTRTVDHIEALLKFVTSRQAPWFILQPNYVYSKPFWQTLTAQPLQPPRPFFLTPTTPRKYKYKTPAGLRHVQNAQALNTSPFITFWYCWVGGEKTAALYAFISQRRSNLSLACSEYFLPDAFKDSNDKTRRKAKTKTRNEASHKNIRKVIQKKKKLLQ